ncbi:hypothetical protein [Polaromonas naphthalenivorans]|uniref:Uncharacterized protein n=1 Tax=Polaromonas naphthalenivorans (strain CJ2) TaxID=365044 RepID=A1VSP1_POLNA|nr:hypothetical protein [Polaromonas naphthalenivorans]ABM38669.1 conserved hypothetical protein [Polaromonas naphthalenivorans CJ2]
MNRCTPQRLSLVFVLAASAMLATLPAGAQTATEFKPAVRTFPAAALRGEMVVTAPPAITLDGKADRLSVGSRIRDADNRLVLSGALVNQKLPVNYLREGAGNVHEVWILNSEEIKLKRPNSKASWFSFGSSTDAPGTISATTNAQ